MVSTLIVIDDLDGTQGAETVTFSYRGQGFEIDLGSKNQQRFDSAMAEFISHARKASGADRPSSTSLHSQRAKRDPQELLAIRTWARANGWPDLSDRGRIPAEAEAAYSTANK